MLAQTNDSLGFNLDDIIDQPNRVLIVSTLGKKRTEDLIEEMKRDYSERVGFPPNGVNLQVLGRANEALRKRLIAAGFKPHFCRNYLVESLVRLHTEILSIYHY